MLLRDLWGPGVRKKFPIQESALLYGLFCALISPFILIGFVFGGGAVKVRISLLRPQPGSFSGAGAFLGNLAPQLL
jgi:hypothetical protein